MYVQPGAKKYSQWQAITRYARNFGIRTAIFITWNPTRKAQLAKLAKEGIKKGELVFVISLR